MCLAILAPPNYYFLHVIIESLMVLYDLVDYYTAGNVWLYLNQSVYRYVYFDPYNFFKLISEICFI